MRALWDVSAEQVATLDQLVDLAQGLERSLSTLQAARDGVLALASRWALSVAGDADEADVSVRAVAAELGAALRVTDRTVQRRMAEASERVERFPLVWQAQGAGRITAGHARVIVDAGAHLDDPAARDAYSARVVEVAERESPNRVRGVAARIAEQYQPRPLEDRHRDAREKRSAWVKDAPDGMAEFGVFGPAALIHGAFDRLTTMAKALTDPDPAAPAGSGEAFGPAATRTTTDADADLANADAASASMDPAVPDTRTLSQKRADLALDVLLTGAPVGHDTPDGRLAGIVAQVSVTIPVTTLMGAG
ncbi:DUF222 domain-containing protein, partial [Microbacterium sp.]|uniref:DUF222 domain-containing protein n=1 Tax=Microbacterium sp. TaxID=51671 RepID=UPI002811426E